MFVTSSPRQTYERHCSADFFYDPFDSEAVAVHRLGLERVLEVHPIATWMESGRAWTNFDSRWACDIAKNALGERAKLRVHRFRDRLQPPEIHEQTVITNYRQAIEKSGMDPVDVPHAIPAKLMPHCCSGHGCSTCDELFR
jgi:hypothetical protein